MVHEALQSQSRPPSSLLPTSSLAHTLQPLGPFLPSPWMCPRTFALTVPAALMAFSQICFCPPSALSCK